jgi:hypothetical protein
MNPAGPKVITINAVKETQEVRVYELRSLRLRRAVMVSKTCMFALCLLVLSPFLTAQEEQSQSNRSFPEDTLAAGQLVAWSWMQKPQPLPQPVPAPGNLPPAQKLSQSGQPQETREIFIGKIVQDRDRLSLRTSGGTTYGLSERDNSKQYEGKDVRISGYLDAAANTVHIIKIEPLS